MKYCSKCGNEIFEEAVICVKCGCPVPKQSKTIADYKAFFVKNKVVTTIVSVVLVVVIVWGGISINSHIEHQQIRRRAEEAQRILENTRRDANRLNEIDREFRIAITRGDRATARRLVNEIRTVGRNLGLDVTDIVREMERLINSI